ncbi:hypothetical protein IEQ34_000876 [Dendrobium chrysotoxum]|uniref:Uncharacterized protein n=1 Tax=Dendrobium chrysotoxum TaxID=161865 RepID=A0AAV7HUC7_DENCH|nr:hypothetical protein IEQ34_000876 [Dendrobium chrysotoxum]
MVVEDGGVDVRLELSLGLSSGEAEPRKRVKENNEVVIVKKPKIEGLMPYVFHVPIFMEFVGNNVYESRDNPSLALEMDGVSASDWQVEVTS